MNKYAPLLKSGENVGDIAPAEHGSHEWAYGYGYGKIEDSSHIEGDSVVLDVEPGGAVEPVLIASDITLTVNVLQGRGYAVVYNIKNEDGVRVVELKKDTDPLILHKGDAYYYLNGGEDDLILRDDSTPAFKDGDETQLTIGDGQSVRLPKTFWKNFELTSGPSPHLNHISEYEEWAAKYWLYKPGSIEAQSHARAKLDEETDELIEAITTGTPEEIIDEAGDMLWTATATGSNAGITVTEVLRSAFPKYFKPGSLINTEDVDRLAKMLFDGISPKDVAEYLKDNSGTLGKTAQAWFALQTTVSTPEKTFADGWINHKRSDAVDAITMITLLVSFIAQQYAGKGLKSVLEANYQKIEQRVKTKKEVTS